MCGIAGVMVRQSQSIAPAVIARLTTALEHRGPDGSGYFAENNVCLLNTRLAIIDVAHGHQPFVRPDTVLVANGEIYNDLTLRQLIPDSGFATGSDCEPPVHLYRRYGETYAHMLRGMYAIAIYDRNAGTLILSRDPYGIKQLYIVETENYLAFASEPAALIQAGLAPRSVDHAACAELLQLQFTTGDKTAFSAIRRVLPGETIVVRDGRIVRRYSIKPAVKAAPARAVGGDGEAAAAARLDRHLTETVELHSRSDVPSGLFLSGGIDSSALLAVMSRLKANPVKALTASFPDARAKDEAEKATHIARAFGAEHHVVEVGAANLWNDAPKLAAAMDDPTTDSSALPLFVLAGAAKARGLKVVLSGEGADEMFGGYKRYRRARWLFGLLSQKTRTRGVFTPELARERLAGWRSGLAETETRERARGLSSIQALQAIDCAEWLPNDLLVKLDRCLMAHGVEGRTPFVDPVFSPFAQQLPDTLKVRGKFGKYLLRAWLAEHAPEADAWSKKQGFVPPVGAWIAERGDRVATLLLGHKGLRALNFSRLVGWSMSNPVRTPQAAWTVLFFALWYAHHIQGIAADGTVDEVLDQARIAA